MSVKLAAPFKIHNRRNDFIQEFNVYYNEERNSFEKFLEFIELYKDKRINVEFSGNFPMGVVTSINKISDNVYVRLKTEQFVVIDELKINQCKFYFGPDNPVYNYASLESFINLGVTDVYPADDLLYNIQETKNYCQGKNIGMRLVLNKIPSTTIDRGNTYKSQIYSPQNIDVLDKYFDAYEFDCGKRYDWAKFDVLYRAWFERQGWNGDLSEINDDLNLPYPILSVMPEIVAIKMECGRRCNRREIPTCRKCEQYLEIGMAMAEQSVYLKSNRRRMPKTKGDLE